MPTTANIPVPKISSDKKKSKSDKPRLSVPYSFRLSEVDAQILDSKVQRSGMAFGDFMRDAVLKNRTVIVERKRETADHRALRFVFNKTSNNVNQIAHALNTAAKMGQLNRPALLAALYHLDMIVRYLSSVLHHDH